jgi:protein O-GlcNAc transferase
VRVRSMSTADAVRAMADHRLHLAINLNGHHWNAASESVRFSLFSRHSAPTRAAYMGYPGPTGASNLQHTYVDTAAVPTAHAAHFTERLIMLPHTYYLNDYASSHAELAVGRTRIAPSADGLSTRCAYLCSLNQLPKLDPRLYAAWLNALARSAARGPPCTRLWILRFPASGEAHLQQEARAHSSPPPRTSLVGLPTVRHADHLRRAQHCELKLDSTLCNAHTSGTDALWAGTPMLTLPGETQASRVALSLLRAVGLPQSVARSLREYEELVVELTSDPRGARSMA